ncbi:MAG: PAS domain S-box protein [Ilumatobacter sp.]
MSPAERLAELLSSANARAIAFDPRGGRAVPLPKPLARRAPSVDTSTLDEIESSAAARIAYESARRLGHGSAPIEFVDHDDPFWFEVFDLTDSYRCFVGVAVPSAELGHGHDQIRSVPTPRRAVYTVDDAGIVRSVTPEFEHTFGWPAHRRVGRAEASIVHPDDWSDHVAARERALDRPGVSSRGIRRFLRLDGTWCWCEVSSVRRVDLDTTRVEHQLAETSERVVDERDAIADALVVAGERHDAHLGADDDDVAESA